MSIRDLTEQFTIQGAFCIKAWYPDKGELITVAEGNDFDCDRWDIDDEILEGEILYMFVQDDVLHIEIDR